MNNPTQPCGNHAPGFNQGARVMRKMSNVSLLRRGLGIAAVIVASVLQAGCGNLYDRDDFTKAVQNKSDDEITKAIGRPSSVDSSNAERVVWTYKSTTFDPKNGNKRDSKSIVVLTPDSAGGHLRGSEVRFE